MSAVVPEWLRRRLARAPLRADATGRREAAVAVVLAAHGQAHGTDVLFIKRAHHAGDPWSGQMALPGGRRESNDDDLLATAIRETLEETGIALDSTCLIGELDDLAPQTAALPPVLVRPFVFVLQQRPKVNLSREVSSYLWFSLDDLPAAEGQSVVSVRDNDLTVPAYLVGGEVVWGMTFRIVSSVFAHGTG